MSYRIEHSHGKCVKLKMRGRKIRSGAYWHRALKQKGYMHLERSVVAYFVALPALKFSQFNRQLFDTSFFRAKIVFIFISWLYFQQRNITSTFK